MANVNRVKLFHTKLGESAAAMVQRIDTWLQSVGDIDLIDASVHRRTLRSRASDIRVSMVYGAGPSGHPLYSGIPVRAVVFTPDSADLSVNTQIATFFSVDQIDPVTSLRTQNVPLHLLDISDDAISGGSGTTILALYSDYKARRNYGSGREVFFAAPLASIAAGADGPCQIFDAFGTLCLPSESAPLLTTATVRNMASVSTWTAGERNYVVMCPLTNRWIGTAPCQYALAEESPLRAYRAGPFPRVGGQTSADQKAMTVAYRASPYTPVP